MASDRSGGGGGGGGGHGSDTKEVELIEVALHDKDDFSDSGSTGSASSGALSLKKDDDTHYMPKSRKDVRRILKDIATIAGPVIVTYFAQVGLGVITIIFAGQLGAKYLAGISLGTLLANVTCYSIGFGLLTAVDTLSSQAHGAGNFARVGIVAQRGALIMLLLMIPVAVLWLNTEAIMLKLGQPSDVAELAGEYTRLTIPAALPMLLYEVTKRFLSAQQIVTPALRIAIVVLLLHPLWCYILTHPFDMHFRGCVIAVTISSWSLFLGLLGYCMMFHPHDEGTWPRWSRESFRGWWEFLKLGVPGAASLSLEWWSFEFTAIAAGMFGTESLASHNILANIVVMSYMVPLGISIAAGTLIGNRLGAGEVGSAKEVTVVAVGAACGVAVIEALAFIVLRGVVARAFTQDEVVVDKVGSLVFFMAAFMVSDAAQGVYQGVLRGVGKQSTGAVVTILAYYGISLPLAFTLAFAANMELSGLWLGLAIGYMCAVFMYLFVAKRLDWMKARDQAVELAEAGDSSASQVKRTLADAAERVDTTLIDGGDGTDGDGETTPSPGSDSEVAVRVGSDPDDV